jgi:iron complex transport system ATP-binding protein
VSLAARDLAFGYPGRTIGRGVTLDVAPGRVLALLGPNGGGKTTLMKTLLGLLPTHGGSVALDGRPVAAVPVGERARLVGYVPQAHAGAFAFSVLEMVVMGRTARSGLLGRPSARDREVALAMLRQLGVGHLAEQPYTMISGGERQLVFMARALAQEPRYVVLDEPTASLDFGNQGLVMRRIVSLARDGLGVLFTTHDPNQALRHADDVALLSRGTIAALGAPSVLLHEGTLGELYGVGVETVEAPDGRRAFLPG